MSQPVQAANPENADSLTFLLRHNARAPLRRLLPFSLMVGIAIGISVGIAVGVPANQVGSSARCSRTGVKTLRIRGRSARCSTRSRAHWPAA